MASHHHDFHMQIPKMVPMTANQIAIPYHPLLKQLTALLKFHDHVYHIQDFAKNSAYVSVQTDIQMPSPKFLALTYVGKHADTIEESCEKASKKAVQNISKKWGVIIQDLSFEKYSNLARCSRLYKLKCSELECIIKGEDIGDQEEQVPAVQINVRHLFLDYMPLLKKIFSTIEIQCTTLETVKHCANHYTCWIMIKPQFNNASKEIFIGPICDTLATAKNYLANKVIMYLIPAYNLEIVDANYATSESNYTNLQWNFELESYLSIRGRMNGIPVEPAFSCHLIERVDLATENPVPEIPGITPAPIKRNTKRKSRLASPENVVVCLEKDMPVYYKVRSQERSCSKRTRNA